ATVGPAVAGARVADACVRGSVAAPAATIRATVDGPRIVAIASVWTPARLVATGDWQRTAGIDRVSLDATATHPNGPPDQVTLTLDRSPERIRGEVRTLAPPLPPPPLLRPPPPPAFVP